MRMWLPALCLALFLPLQADARSHEGVTLPDTVNLGGQNLVLNGMGLREKYFIDIYVAGLYLPAKTSDASKAISDDVPKRIDMAMTYELEKAKLADTMREGIGSAGNAEAKKHAGTLAGWMEDVTEGDHIIIDYVPGKGTTITVKGKVKGTIPGPEFMQGIFSVYLGPNPPTGTLKKGLLGG